MILRGLKKVRKSSVPADLVLTANFWRLKSRMVLCAGLVLFADF